MPKIISEHEREQTRNAIMECTKQLIYSNNGIKNITIDDIVNCVGMGKGSFYSYYKSKEECFYEVIKKWEQELFKQLEANMKKKISHREKITTFLRQNYLSENGISRYISTTDLEILLRKLPPEFKKAEKEKATDYQTSAMKLFNVGEVQMETLGALLDCIGFVNNNPSLSMSGKNETLDALIVAIVDYVERNGGVTN